MRATVIMLCGLVTGCSASFTGLAIEGLNGSASDVILTSDNGDERISITAPRANLACLGLSCDMTRIPGETACNEVATNPFAGTRITEFFACYGASGACTEGRNSGNLGFDFANGARLKVELDESLLSGPGANDPCILGGQQYSNSGATEAFLYFQR